MSKHTGTPILIITIKNQTFFTAMMRPNDVGDMAISVDTDQTALGAV